MGQLSKIEQDFFGIEQAATLLGGRYFKVGSTVEIPTSGEYILSVAPDEPVYFHFDVVGQTGNYTMEVWEGGTLTGGTPLPLNPQNRVDNKEFPGTTLVNHTTFDSTGATEVAELVVDDTQQNRGATRGNIGPFLLCPSKPWTIVLKNNHTGANTLSWLETAATTIY